MGDLLLEPQLDPVYFDSQAQATIYTLYAEKRFRVTYINPNRLDVGDYSVQDVLLNGESIQFRSTGNGAILSRNVFADLTEDNGHHLEVLLNDNKG